MKVCVGVAHVVPALWLNRCCQSVALSPGTFYQHDIGKEMEAILMYAWGDGSLFLLDALFLSVWRHVDKGTPEGAIDAMLIHGQGKQSI